MKKLVFMILALLIMTGCASILEDREAKNKRAIEFYDKEVRNFPGGIQ